MDQAPILEFENVYKNYGNKRVISGLEFNFSNNEIVALLGINGAGKTTAIKMMLGQEVPTSGSVRLFGKNPQNPKSRIQVGSTPQNVEFPESIKSIEILKFVHAHYPQPLPISHMIEQFGLNSFLNAKASKLSGGQKRRLALALAFIGNPKIVFLDEPTTGLDVESRKILLNAIKDYSKQGKAIFLTTHYLEEIEQLATRIIFLHNGIIKADGSVNEIKKMATSSLTKVIFACATQYLFESFQNVDSYECYNNVYSLQTKNPDKLVYELVEKKIPFSNLQIVRENLESAFLNLAKGNKL